MLVGQARSSASRPQVTLVYEVSSTVMKVGDRVRVSESVVVYHHPKHRNQPLDLKGKEGEIIGLASEWQGKTISANFPWIIKFESKFKAHLREEELELIEG